MQPGTALRRHGFTLVELSIVLAIVGVMVAVGVSSMNDWSENQRLIASAQQVSGAFSYARGEAIRTGNIHVVFVQTDALGNTLTSPIVVLNDGAPGSADQDCDFDTGEPTQAFTLEAGVAFGQTLATAKVPTDPGGGSLPGSSTFEDAASNAASWVLFRPEGMPLAFSSDCTTGAVGTGGGGIYLTNGIRDSAVVVTPLGAARVHSWNPASDSWTQ